MIKKIVKLIMPKFNGIFKKIYYDYLSGYA